MAVITDISVQKRNSDRVSIFLDGEFAFGLLASVAEELRLGQELSESEIKRLQRQEQFEQAKQNAFGLVSGRPRSEFELRTHLSRKHFEADVIEDVVLRLRELALLDDMAFAEYWVEQRESFRPRSHMALRQELYQKGISREIIDQVLETVDEVAAAGRAAEKRAHQWAGLPKETFSEKMAGYLGRRGFSYEIINEITEKAWQAVNEA